MDRQIEIEKHSKMNMQNAEILDSSENILNSTDNSLLITENHSNESNSLLSEEISLKSSNISNSNKNHIDSIDFSNNSSVSSSNVIQQPEISWRREASIGNFMPAVVLLDRKQLMVNEPIDPISENRLIHLAVTFSYLNVTRCLIELFDCDINIRNAAGQSALHIACNNPSQDAYLLSYLIKNDLLQVNITDNSGVTPLFYAVLNKFNIAILALTYLKSDLTHIDNLGNNIFYFSLTSDNKFAMKFLMRHFPSHNLINQTYYKKQATLADVLITTKNTSCAKHIVKYYYDDLSVDSIISCKKDLNKFNVYNKFNYDMLNTLYYFKTKDYRSFFRALLRKDTDSEEHFYSYKLYNLSLMIYDYLIPSTSKLIKMGMLWVYSILLCDYFFILFIISKSKEEEYGYLQTTIDLWQISSLFTLILCMIKFTFYKYTDNFYEENQYNLTNPNYARENVCHQIYEAMERNPLDLFFEEEICEICLIRKDKSTNHCHMCRKCVKDFYFHSKLLNICFSKQNISYYIMLLSSFAAVHIYIVGLLFQVLDIESQGVDKKSIYTSENYTTNLVIFFMNASFYKIFLCLFFFITGVLYFQKLMTLVICLGYKTTYYNMFRYHKRSVGVIQQRGNLYYNIPQMNLISLKEFFVNLIFRK
jgi:ankyrin repeat protein